MDFQRKAADDPVEWSVACTVVEQAAWCLSPEKKTRGACSALCLADSPETSRFRASFVGCGFTELAGLLGLLVSTKCGG